MSFLFCCADEQGPIYQIETRDTNGKITTQKIKNIEDVDLNKIKSASKVIRLEESDYKQLKFIYSGRKKWTDP